MGNSRMFRDNRQKLTSVFAQPIDILTEPAEPAFAEFGFIVEDVILSKPFHPPVRIEQLMNFCVFHLERRPVHLGLVISQDHQQHMRSCWTQAIQVTDIPGAHDGR